MAKSTSIELKMYFDQIQFAYLKNKIHKNFLDILMLENKLNVPQLEFYFTEHEFFDYPGPKLNMLSVECSSILKFILIEHFIIS